jgi:hypothetical protein
MEPTDTPAYHAIVIQHIGCQSLLLKSKVEAQHNTTGAETTHPSGKHEFTPVVKGFHVAQSLVFCNVFRIIVCPFVFLLLSIVLL